MKVYAVKHKDDSIRQLSRSGGVFTALTDKILEMGGGVYGCAMNGFFSAIHSYAESKEERDLFRGSKYIESNLSLNTVYKDSVERLHNGIPVLFSGTSCQTNGLLGFVPPKLKDNLYTVDILCHGIPTPIVWRTYLEWFSSLKKGDITGINFRNKTKFGWADHTETIEISGKEYDNKYYRDLYSSGCITRPACYNCPYKNTNHVTDITIGDYWGLENVLPGFGSDNKGVSLVLVNTEKGQKLFDSIKENLIYEETDIDHCMQGALRQPYDRPKGRDVFWEKFCTLKFDDIIKEYTSSPLKSKIKMLIPSSVRKKIRGK